MEGAAGRRSGEGRRAPAAWSGAARKPMSIYKKYLRRLRIILIAVSILDALVELIFYQALQSSSLAFARHMQTPLGICLRNGIGLLTGILACGLDERKKNARWIVRAMILLLAAALPCILLLRDGSVSDWADGLINATLILMAMVVYTALQLERSERNWQRIRNATPSVLDLKLNDVRQWFNPIKIGPQLDMNQDIAATVIRFLETAREPRPLEITVRCPGAVSELMQATMQEVFQMHFEDEERHINTYLERRYVRAMVLVIVSIIAVSVWINLSAASNGGVTWAILSNFAGFSLWQIGYTYFERSEGYGELLRAMIAKQAKIRFWGE